MHYYRLDAGQLAPRKGGPAMEGWRAVHTRERDRIRQITSSCEFHEMLKDLLRRELAREGRSGLAIEADLARAVALAVRGSVEMILPLTEPDSRADWSPLDEVPPAPYPTFPTEPQ
jgi:hypothetical protein